MALVIEIVGGLLGFMGIGHMLTGRLVPGIALLVGWWVAIALSSIVILPLVLLTCGLGACLLPFLWAGPPILFGPVAAQPDDRAADVQPLIRRNSHACRGRRPSGRRPPLLPRDAG